MNPALEVRSRADLPPPAWVRRGREAGRGRRPQRKRERSAAGWEAPALLACPGGAGRCEGTWDTALGSPPPDVLTLEVEGVGLASTQSRARGQREGRTPLGPQSGDVRLFPEPGHPWGLPGGGLGPTVFKGASGSSQEGCVCVSPTLGLDRSPGTQLLLALHVSPSLFAFVPQRVKADFCSALFF